MYNWNIDIYLKSGAKLECTYPSDEDNTYDVATKLFVGKTAQEFIGLSRREGRGDVYLDVGEVAAFDIYL